MRFGIKMSSTFILVIVTLRSLQKKQSSEGNLYILKIPSFQHSAFFFYIYFYFILFIYFWLCWVFVAARGLSLVTASRGYSSLQCVGFSLQWLLLLRSTGSRHTGFSSCCAWASVVVAHGPQCII